MGESTSQWPGHGDDVLPGVGKVDRALPGHDTEDVERKQDTRGMDLRIGALQEIGDDVRTLDAFRFRDDRLKAGRVRRRDKRCSHSSCF